MKKILSIVICSILFLGVIGCGNKEENKFIGTYKTMYGVDGEQYYQYIEIKKDGTYTKSTFKFNKHVSTQKGDYEITGNEIVLYADEDHKSWTSYDYRADKLFPSNNDLYYERYDGEIPKK